MSSLGGPQCLLPNVCSEPKKGGLGRGQGPGVGPGRTGGPPRFEAAHSEIRIKDWAAVRLEAALSICAGVGTKEGPPLEAALYLTYDSILHNFTRFGNFQFLSKRRQLAISCRI